MEKKRRWWIWVLGVVAALAAVVLLGPRPPRSPDVPLIEIGEDVSRYVEQSESRFDDIVPGTEKLIEWTGTPGERSDISVVFLHGFSGSRQEMVPAPQMIARQLQANLFSTRYAGHGRGRDAMGEPDVDDWVADTVEAIEIGRSIGDYVVVIAVSTAAPLVTYLDANGVDADALVLASPNFAPADESAELLLLPWGKLIARLVVGKYMRFEVVSADHERYTTSSFPSGALVTMMGAVQLGAESVSDMNTPALFLFSEEDETISVDAVKRAYEESGSSPKELREIVGATSHVLAGDIFNPRSTDELVDAVVRFVETLRQ